MPDFYFILFPSLLNFLPPKKADCSWCGPQCEPFSYTYHSSSNIHPLASAPRGGFWFTRSLLAVKLGFVWTRRLAQFPMELRCTLLWRPPRAYGKSTTRAENLSSGVREHTANRQRERKINRQTSKCAYCCDVVSYLLLNSSWGSAWGNQWWWKNSVRSAFCNCFFNYCFSSCDFWEIIVFCYNLVFFSLSEEESIVLWKCQYWSGRAYLYA